MPFLQSLTLDLGAVASPSKSNLNWVWHDHVSVELVKAHYTGFVLALPCSVHLPLQNKYGEQTKLVKVHQCS